MGGRGAGKVGTPEVVEEVEVETGAAALGAEEKVVE